MHNEPVLVTITAFVGASIALLAAFGLDFTDDQIKAILAFVAAGYGAGVLIRSRVTPTGRGR